MLTEGNMSVLVKIIDYLYLVLFNRYFLLGIILGYILKSYFGGKFISILTGMVFGCILSELFKLLAFM